MANSDKNIVIQPSIGSTVDQPSITFTGAGNSSITLKVLDDAEGTLSFEGYEGQVFALNNNLSSGVIYSVNDISGFPIIDADASGNVRLSVYSGNVGIGTTLATAKLDVNGTVKATSFSGDGSGITGVAGTGGLSNLVEDTTPQLGGNLDLNSNDITGTGNVNITGIITATSFEGDGSNLTGISAGTTPTENTTNQSQYIPFYVGTSSTDVAGVSTESLVFNPSTNRLGIGTTNPDAALHVVDDILVSAGAAATLDVRIKTYSNENGSISFENAVDSTQYFSITQDLSTLLFGVNDANFNTVFVVDPNGNVGVKTDSIGASRALDVYGNVVISGSSTLGTLKIETGIVTATSGIITYYGDGQYLQNIITGVSISTNTTNQSQYLTYAVSTGSTTGLGVTTTNLVYNPSTNRLGIGTTNPDAALHVVDDILVSAGAAATLDVRIKTYSNENGSISFENAVDGSSIFTLQQGDSDILFDVSTSPTNQVFQVGVDSSIIISSGVSTEDFKIKAYTDELGSLSFEDPVDSTQYFSITQDLSTTLFAVNNDSFETQFIVDADGDVGIGTDNPTSKLHVVGVVSATTYYGDGTNLDNVKVAISATTTSLVAHNATFATTGLSTTITPIDTSKKVYVDVSVPVYMNKGASVDYQHMEIDLRRNGTSLMIHQTGLYVGTVIGRQDYGTTVSFHYVDSPSTVGITTYEVFARSQNTTTNYWSSAKLDFSNTGSILVAPSRITLMEVD